MWLAQAGAIMVTLVWIDIGAVGSGQRAERHAHGLEQLRLAADKFGNIADVFLGISWESQPNTAIPTSLRSRGPLCDPG